MKDAKGFLWLKIAYTLMVCVIAPVYWVEHGPTNFLWFSDIALFVMLAALWLESRFLTSMMAVGVLPLEFLWMADFFTGGYMMGLAEYMFRGDMETYLRILSGVFHFAMPLAIVFMLWRYGYDRRALGPQIILCWVVLPLTWILTDPAVENINWVFGIHETQGYKPPLAWLFLVMAFLPTVIYVPTHFALSSFFSVPEKSVS